MLKLEFFFDCSSPWTYLAFSRIHSIAEKNKIKIDWKPILVGGVFNEVNNEIYENRSNPNPVKFKYSRKDLKDWAELCDIKINWPSIFPVKAVKMMRAAIVAVEEGYIVPYSWKCFQSYWEFDKDLNNDDVLRDIILSSGMDADKVFDLINTERIKDHLKFNTSNLIERGGFGSPTIFINESDMYFGNDRLELVNFKIEKLIKDF